MKTSRFCFNLACVLFLYFGLHCLECHAGNVAEPASTSSSVTSVLQGTNPSGGITKDRSSRGNVTPTPRPIDQGLQPLYVMTNSFLDAVKPQSSSDIFADSRFEAAFQADTLDDSLHYIVDSFNDWQFWLQHYVGFAVCVVAGVIFIVAMPIIGLCFCLCRCTGRCGGRLTGDDAFVQKGDDARRGCCGIFLLLVNALIMAGVVCAFVTNELIREQTSTNWKSGFSSNGTGLVSTASSSLQIIGTYQNTVLQQLNTDIINPLKEEIVLINTELNMFPDKSLDRLSEIASMDSIINATESVETTVVSIGDNLELVFNYTTQLQQQQNQLNTSLRQIRENMLNALPPSSVCNPLRSCVQMKDSINKLATAADFTQAQNVAPEVNDLIEFMNGDVRNQLETGREKLHNISSDMLNQVRNQIQTVSQKGNDTIRAVQQIVNKITNEIQSVNTTEANEYLMQTIAPDVDTYGGYRYYIGIGLSSVLALVVLLALFGLCFGVCGETASVDNNGHCTRDTGASFLVAGIAVTFFFTWLLMVAVVVLFVAGGATYTDACRPMVNRQNVGVVRVANEILRARLNRTTPNLQINIIDILAKCESNAGIYSALNLDSVFNLSNVFNQAEIAIWTEVEKGIRQINPDLSNTVIVGPSTFNSLQKAKLFLQTGINFTSFEIPLNEPLISISIDLFVTDLRRQANTASFLDSSQKQTIYNETTALQTITSAIVQSMNSTANNLRSVLSVLQIQIDSNHSQSLSTNIQTLIDALNSTQQAIVVNGSAIILKFVTEFAYNIYSGVVNFMNGMLLSIYNSIGQCRPLFDVYNIMKTAACQSLLNPFNGFWFSIGWCLLFCIPSIIISVHLVNLYRRTDDYSYGSHGKSFDEGCYDAYAGTHHGDNYRLDDLAVSTRPSRVNSSVAEPPRYGHQNLVYEPDDISDPHRRYPGARTNGLRSDPGFVRPSYVYPPGSPHRNNNIYTPN